LARVKEVTRDKVKKLYEEQLGGTEGELVIVGDFDADAAAKQVGDILKDWKAKEPYEHIARKANLTVKGSRESIRTPDKGNALYLAALTLAMKDSDADYPALKVADFLFGSAPLASRLSNRVRGKEGLSYGAGTQCSADARDERGAFVIFAICNPANIDKV